MAAVIHSSDAVGKRFSDLREFRGLRFHRHLTRLDEVEATVDVDACANENEPCHAPRRGLPSERLNLPICRHFLERMMGLEPTTFCMARRTHLPPAAIAAKSRAGSLHSVHFEPDCGRSRESLRNVLSHRTGSTRPFLRGWYRDLVPGQSEARSRRLVRRRRVTGARPRCERKGADWISRATSDSMSTPQTTSRR